MVDVDKGKLDQLFNEVRGLLKQQKEQKARGLNDYNLLTSVLRVGDEVRLHSRFIYSMINKEGAHYQSTLFLKLFIQDVLNHKSLAAEPKINFDALKAHKEWQGGEENGGIDLFLTDGEYYFIIENKLYASDQPRQIARYIKAVKKEYNLSKQQLKSRVFVYYLSPQGKEPTKASLGAFQIKQEQSLLEYIKEDKPIEQKSETDSELDGQLSGSTVNFKVISYKKEIIQWLESCLKESANLTNLNQAFLTYKDVVERVIRVRKSKVVTIKDYLVPKKSDKAIFSSGAKENIVMAMHISQSLNEVKGELLYAFFERINYILPTSESDIPASDAGSECYKYVKGLVKKKPTKAACHDWFMDEKKNRKHVGVLYDIENSEFLLCVIAATKEIHIGVVAKGSAILDESITTALGLEKRNWGGCIEWYSKFILTGTVISFGYVTVKY